MTQGNGPQMTAIIAAATTPAEPWREPGPGDTIGLDAEIEPHVPGAMSERCLAHHDVRTGLLR